ncbi:MAG: InlB B-repeat-containing protein [Bacilli bacterium]|nr:InlB B-repeat-containing protein [Bacilli bacterium]
MAGDNTASEAKCNSPTFAATTAGTNQTPAYNVWPYNRSVYKRKLTVSYNGNGNTGGSTADTSIWQYFNSGLAASSAQITSNSITLANNGFTKTGYTFKEWNTKADGTGTAYAQRAAFTEIGATATDTTVSKTLYAIWTANQYSVSLNKGTCLTDGTTSVTATYNSAFITPATITLASKSYSISGFGLSSSRYSDGATVGSGCSTITSTSYANGYYSTSDGNTKVLAGGSAATTTASWIANVSGYTDANKKWIRDNQSTTLYGKCDNPPAKTLCTIEKPGYVCGWTTSSTGTTIMYSSGGSFAPTANTTMYGVCVSNKVTINVRRNNSAWSNSGMSISLSTSNSTDNASSGFIGTVTGSSTNSITFEKVVAGTKYYIWAGKNEDNKTTRVYTGESFTAEANTTQSASVNYYVVTINRNNNNYGTTSKSSFTVLKNQTMTASSNTLTLSGVAITATPTVEDGYNTTFSKWTQDTTSGTQIGSTAVSITAAKTVYANFNRVGSPYTVSLDKGTCATNGTASVTATYGLASLDPASITLAKTAYNVSGFTTSSTQLSNGATVSSTNTLTSTDYADGYYSTNNGTTKVLTGGSSATATVSLVSNVSGYTDSSGNWSRKSTATLYGKCNNQPAVTLPTIIKTGYKCGWTTSSSGTTIMYSSGASYTPSGNTTMYGVCKPLYYLNTNTNVYYEYLNEALSAVASNQTIKVLNNMVEISNASLASGKTGVKLDLNGKTVDMGTYFINNFGTLDIYNSSSTTAILQGSNADDQNGVIYNSGTLTTNATSSTNPLIIRNTGSNTTSYLEGVVIKNYGSNSSITLNNKTTLTLTNVSSAKPVIYNNGLVNISGGSIINESDGGRGIYSSGDGAKVVITSGTISAHDQGINIMSGTSTTVSAVEMSGGTITTVRDHGILNNAAKNISITGGTISCSSSNCYGISNYSTGDVSITGGTITSGYGIRNSGGASVTINGTSVKVTGTNDYGIYSTSGSVTVTNGEVKGSTNGINSTTGTVTVNGGTVQSTATSGTNGAIYKNGGSGTVTISSGTVSGYYGIYNNAAGPIVITGGTVTGTTMNGIYNKSSGTITITGGTISGVSHGVHLYAASGTLTMGTNDGGTPSTTSPLIKTTGTSNTYGVYVQNASAIYNFYDGKVTSASGTGKSIYTPSDTYVINVPDNYDIVKTTASGTETAVLGAANNYQNTSTNKKYMYLWRAMNEVANSQTIKVLANTTEDLGATLASGKTGVTLDLNGKTVTMNVVYIDNKGSLTVTSGVSGGTLTSLSCPLYNSGTGTLSVTGGTISSTYTVHALRNESTGTINISGGTISGVAEGVYNVSTGTINISGGSITGGSHGIGNATTGSVNVTGGTISGNVGINNLSSGTITVNGTSAQVMATSDIGINSGAGAVTVTKGTVTGKTNGISSTTGAVTVNGGTVTTTGNGATTSGIYKSGATGTVTVSSGSVTGYSIGIYNASTAQVNVSGGTVTGTATYGIGNASTGTISITGGTITGVDGIRNSSTGTITVNGTNAQVTATSGIGIDALTGAVTVTKGTVTGSSHGISSTTGAVTVNGGTVTTTATGGTNAGIYKNGTSGTVTVSSGSVSGPYGIYNNVAGTINVSGGIVTGTKVAGIYNITTGTIGVTGGTIYGYAAALRNQSTGTINISGANTTIECLESVNICVGIFSGAGTTTMSNGTVTGMMEGIRISGNGTVTITGGTVRGNSNGIGISESSTGTLTLGENSGTPSTTTPLIESYSTYAIAQTSHFSGVRFYSDSATFNFYDGKITSTAGTGFAIYYNGTINTPSGYVVIKTTTSGTETAILQPKTPYVYYNGTGSINTDFYYEWDALHNNVNSHSNSVTSWQSLRGLTRATVSNTTWGTDNIYFNGTNAGALTETRLTTTYPSMTAEVEFMVTTVPSSPQYLLSNMNNGGFGLLIASDGKVGFNIMNGSTSHTVFTTSAISANKRYHVAGTFDGSTIKIYVNGSLNNSVSYSGSVLPSDSSTVVAAGCNPVGAACEKEYFKGYIYNFSFIIGNSSARGDSDIQTDSGKTVTYGSTYGTLPTPVRAGYSFGGWYSNTGLTSQVSSSTTVTNESDHVLYAKWNPITYNISYDLDNGSFGTNHPTSATYGSVIQIDNPTKSGYIFAGWTATGLNNTYTTAATGTSTSNVFTIWQGAATTNQYFKNLTSASGGTVTLTATWTRDFTCATAGTDINYVGPNATNRSWRVVNNDTTNRTCELVYNGLVGNSAGNAYDGSSGTTTGNVYSYIKSFSNGSRTIEDEYNDGYVTNINSATSNSYISSLPAVGNGTAYWYTNPGYAYKTNIPVYSLGSNFYAVTGYMTGQYSGTAGAYQKKYLTGTQIKTVNSYSSSNSTGGQSVTSGATTVSIANGQVNTVATYSNPYYSIYETDFFFLGQTSNTYGWRLHKYCYQYNPTSNVNTTNYVKTGWFFVVISYNQTYVVSLVDCNESTCKYSNTNTSTNATYTKNANRYFAFAGRQETNNGTYDFSTSGYTGTYKQYTTSAKSYPIMYRPHITVKY